MLFPTQQKVELILAYTMNLWEHAVSKFLVLRSRPKAVGIQSRLPKRLNFVSGSAIEFVATSHWKTQAP